MITLSLAGLVSFQHLPNGWVSICHKCAHLIHVHPIGGCDVLRYLWCGFLLVRGVHVEPMCCFQYLLSVQLIGVVCVGKIRLDHKVGQAALFVDFTQGCCFRSFVLFRLPFRKVINPQPFNGQKLIVVVGD